MLDSIFNWFYYVQYLNKLIFISLITLTSIFFKMTLEELRLLTLFNTVDSRPGINQRQLAQEWDVSLGLSNTYFQRVLKKGWIRAKQVKPRRWLYFLTPQGALEKSRLSLSYLNRTLDSFRELKRKGDDHLHFLSKKGVRGIHLCGEDDLTEILSFCFLFCFWKAVQKNQGIKYSNRPIMFWGRICAFYMLQIAERS